MNLLDRLREQMPGKAGDTVPSVRKRHPLALSLDEREEVSRALVEKKSIRAIASKLSKASSTISREIKRLGGAKLHQKRILLRGNEL